MAKTKYVMPFELYCVSIVYWLACTKEFNLWKSRGFKAPRVDKKTLIRAANDDSKYNEDWDAPFKEFAGQWSALDKRRGKLWVFDSVIQGMKGQRVSQVLGNYRNMLEDAKAYPVIPTGQHQDWEWYETGSGYQGTFFYEIASCAHVLRQAGHVESFLFKKKLNDKKNDGKKNDDGKENDDGKKDETEQDEKEQENENQKEAVKQQEPKANVGPPNDLD